jgi:hypothetical protein
MDGEGRSNVEMTLASYEQSIEAYLAQSPATPSASYAAFRETVLTLLPRGAQMLELGSGPGHDAAFFASKGVEVHRTDGAQGFVDRLRAEGHQADLLDITIDDLGGPYDVVFANAVLLHLTANQFDHVAMKASCAVTPDGLLAFTVKAGDGDEWSTRKLDQPRYFRYWQRAELNDTLVAAGWTPLSIDHVQGRLEPWHYVICCRTAPQRAGPRGAPRAQGTPGGSEVRAQLVDRQQGAAHEIGLGERSRHQQPPTEPPAFGEAHQVIVVPPQHQERLTVVRPTRPLGDREPGSRHVAVDGDQP